jgi:ABC-type branched-subunit amino acid transport system substrate-binding protein/mono/diheme cytochrome c family protein
LKNRAFSRSSLASLLVALAMLGYTAGGQRALRYQDLSAQQLRGKQIFQRGTSPTGADIVAYLGGNSLAIPASALTCGSCHGSDGLGRPEGGFEPSAIDWESLTRPYGHRHPTGAQHPAFDEKSLAAAIRTGMDPAGNPLLAAMPRYSMPDQEMADLIAYLKIVGKDLDPGIDEVQVTIGLLASPGELPHLSDKVLSAYLGELNAKGGLFGRRLELMEIRDTDPAAQASVLRRAIEGDELFMVLSAAAQPTPEVREMLESRGIPLFSAVSTPAHRHSPSSFSILPGTGEQLRTLARHVFKNLGEEVKAAVVFPVLPDRSEVLEGMDEDFRTLGRPLPLKITYDGRRFQPDDLVARLKGEGVDAVFFLGPGKDQQGILAAAERQGWTPFILLPASGVSQAVLEAPRSFAERIFMAFSILPDDQNAEAVLALQNLLASQELPPRAMAASLPSYLLAKITVEALSRAGRGLSRERFLTELEALYEYPTGLTRPISYGPNRRIGLLGAYLVSADLEEKSFRLVEWIYLD